MNDDLIPVPAQARTAAYAEACASLASADEAFTSLTGENWRDLKSLTWENRARLSDRLGNVSYQLAVCLGHIEALREQIRDLNTVLRVGT